MTPLYQSRQVSWFMIGMIAVMAVFFSIMIVKGTEEAPPWFYPAILLIMLPFSTMSVTVTRVHVRIAFLLGWPRRTIRIGDLKSCETYRAKGLQRLATRIRPFQGTYQMTGGGGIVLVRHKGIPITISDPEPDKLARAVTRARDKHEQLGRT
ncbi:hypothetical protein H8E07_06910 [bacterium]|nr:hypothetical protein [bacterium]